jgi:transcriptional regulator with AAA-type ATPase domain
MFGRHDRKNPPSVEHRLPRVFLTVALANEALRDREGLDLLRRQLPAGQDANIQTLTTLAPGEAVRADYLLALFCEPDALDPLADAVLAARAEGRETVLIIAVQPRQLTALGRWLKRRAEANRLAGVRLMVAQDVEAAAHQLADRLRPVPEDNLIRMPRASEVDGASTQAFFVFSPELQALIGRLRAFALNGIDRVLLLGGPGSGKTSLAYFYYLLRHRGRFVSVNLAAENTGDKAAVKSLLCGHVSGAFPGAGARVGAFQHSRDGVCFLDESHQISGAVMEVLMEALDNGQYLPYGASAKQPLECALLFASNRSWQQLQNAVNLDEFTRLGAAVAEVPGLAQREEDLIAVVATTLARLAAPCRSWIPPDGLHPDAWRRLREGRWHGNVRGLIRVLESAFIDTTTHPGSTLIETHAIDAGLQRWEPATHHSHSLYAAA